MEIRPFYQRRSRWDTERQSKLIESFIINIPVPPLFLYEKAYNSYEVMDGQQRITAISDYYSNKFALTGLDLWPELNGMRYSDLPNKIRAGLDRRSISSVILLKESAPEEEDAIFLRRLVFERLNTGGVKLERQEIRNSFNRCAFSDMLYKLAQTELFRKIWQLPLFVDEELINHQLPIHDSAFYKKMEDLEVILRFFAFRHMDNFKYGIQGFLDLYMHRSRAFNTEDIRFLSNLFNKTLNTAYNIYKDYVFQVYEEDKWSGKPIKGLYDAIMVPLSEFILSHDDLVRNREEIINKTIELFKSEGSAIVTGRASTKNDLVNRINIFRQLFASILK